MGNIKARFNIDALFNKIDKKLRPVIPQVVAEAMAKTCLEVTAMAKELNTYKDQTNNLRSSIGYVIYDHGEKVAEYFEKSGLGKGSGAAGIARGKAVANEAAKTYPKETVGVLVAGEYYALFVESKGYDVLTGPSLKLQSIFEKNLKIAFDALNIEL